jgi:hypothetical protein
VEVGVLGVEEIKEEVSVYPNPTNSVLFVETPYAVAQYRVFNLMGQQILSGKASGTLQIDFISRPKGVYVLQVVSEGQMVTQKIIVQ